MESIRRAGTERDNIIVDSTRNARISFVGEFEYSPFTARIGEVQADVVWNLCPAVRQDDAKIESDIMVTDILQGHFEIAGAHRYEAQANTTNLLSAIRNFL